jgi:uncharacterized membrane protein
MEPFFNPNESRYVAAGLFLGIAAVLGLLWGGLLLLKRREGWPLYAGGFLGLMLWQITAVGLWWDGAIGAGLVLTAFILVLLMAACATFLVNDHPWLIAVGFALLGAGAFAALDEWITVWLWLTGTFVMLFAALLLTVFLSGQWWPPLGYTAAGLTLVALGAASGLATSAGASVLWRNVTAVRAAEPLWLVLLLLIPLTVWWSFRSLAGLGAVRRWLALTLRCSLLLFLTLALAEVYLLHTNDTLTVIYLWDRSESLPVDLVDNPNDPATKIDLIADRHFNFVWDSVALRGPKHQRDNVGLIVFGRNPRLELPPANVQHFGAKKITSKVDRSYTDIGAAIKLALACFPEGTGKRIVLISDGNENLGKAVDQARLAKQDGVEIDTVLVKAANRNEHEILVERVEAPVTASLAEGTRSPVRVVIRSYNPRTVVGRVTLWKSSLKMTLDARGVPQIDPRPRQVGTKLVRVRLGLNVISLQLDEEPPKDRKEESHSYEVKFQMLGVEKTPIELDEANLHKLDKSTNALDRPENNQASTIVLSPGEKRVLIVGYEENDHQVLAKQLQGGAAGLKVVSVTASWLKARLVSEVEAFVKFFSEFDCILLANVPRDEFTDEMDAALRTCVHEQGCGLIMVGGRYGFGGGAWQNTEVEKALPVTCDLKSLKVEGRSGLVLIMHASEIAEGNMWQKKIAKLAIEKLGPMDMLGMLYYDWGGGADHKWHIPFQTVGENKQKMLALVDRMNPGDMPDAEPSLKKAYDALTDKQHGLGTKHIIFISDGDHWRPPNATLQKIRAAKITVTTVCITSHGQGEYKNMAVIAKATGGREYPAPGPDGTYKALNPNELPQIYMKETRLVSQSFFHDKPFWPELLQRSGPTEGLPDKLPQLHGFVRTSLRTGPLVQLAIQSPKIGENPWPILAHWQYGLGKGVAFTSDALPTPAVAEEATAWSRDWQKEGIYGQFWQQLVAWSLREVDKGTNLQMTTELRDGKLLIVVHARDNKGNPLSNMEVIVRVTSPNAKAGDASRPDIKLEQKNVGRYEAEIRAEDVGSYFLTARATGEVTEEVDGKKVKAKRAFMARAAVTVPYSPEFAEMENNPGLMQQLSELTGGLRYEDDADELAEVVKSGKLFRPSPARTKSLQSVWYWLLVLTGLGLLFDVAVRRIAVDPGIAAEKVQERWEVLRGLRARVQTQQFLDRLKTRKEQVGESIQKEKAARRFEGGEGDVPPEAPPMAGIPQPGPKPKPRPSQAPKVGPEDEAQPADYASRLLKAKRRAMQDRDKENPK